MALIKNKTTDFGIEANYWKVSMITIDRNLQEATFSICLYLNKNAKAFIECYSVISLLNKEDKTLFEEYFGTHNTYRDVYNACYEYVKKYEDYFKDAIDDEEEKLRTV